MIHVGQLANTLGKKPGQLFKRDSPTLNRSSAGESGQHQDFVRRSAGKSDEDRRRNPETAPLRHHRPGVVLGFRAERALYDDQARFPQPAGYLEQPACLVGRR